MHYLASAASATTVESATTVGSAATVEATTTRYRAASFKAMSRVTASGIAMSHITATCIAGASVIAASIVAVSVAPTVEPWACADEYSVSEVAWAIVAVRGASVGIIGVVAVSACRRTSYADADSYGSNSYNDSCVRVGDWQSQ